MNVNKININQNEQSYYIASDIYDVTAHNNGATFESLSALLSSENLSTLVPSAIRCGGMTIRFIQSSDNKYVRFNYLLEDAITNSKFTNVNNWEKVDIVKNPLFNYQQGYSYEKIKMLDGIKEIYFYYTGTEYIGDTISLERIDRNTQESGSSIVFHNDTKNEHIYESHLNESSTIVRGQTNKDNNNIYFYVVIDWSYFPDNTSTYFNIPLDIEKVISEKWSPIINHQIRIDGLESDVDIYNKEGFHIFKNNGYVMKTNGGIAPGDDWQYTDFIKVNEGDVFNVAIPSSANQFYWKIAYYDENKNFVSGTDNVGAITIPNGIAYFRCCGATSDTKSVRYAYNNTILYNLINSNTIKIGAIEEHIQSIILDKNNLSITKNKYVANNSIENLIGCCYTDYIPVEPGQVWVIENCHLFAYLCEFYNANKDYVSTKGITEGSYETYNVTIPNGCYFMRVNIGM